MLRNGLVYDVGAADDAPRFPLGIFVELSDGIAGRQAALATLAPQGITPLWYTPGGTPAVLDGTAAALASAEAAGVDIAFGLFSNPSGDALFTRPALSAHPAVFGYYHSDDIGYPEFQPITPTQLRQRDAAVKARAINGVTMFSYAYGGPNLTDAVVRSYADGADVVMRQLYPVGNAPLGRAYEMMEQVSTAVAELPVPRAPLGVVQTFNWAEQGVPFFGNQTPTPRQVAQLSYLALVGGSKGLWYYTFGQESASETLEVTDPLIFAEILGVRDETAVIANALLLGRRQVLRSSGNLYVAAWVEGGQRVVIAVDTRTSGGLRETTLALPGDGAWSGLSFVRGGSGSGEVVNGELRLLLTPGQVLVARAVQVIPEPAGAAVVVTLAWLAWGPRVRRAAWRRRRG